MSNNQYDETEEPTSGIDELLDRGDRGGPTDDGSAAAGVHRSGGGRLAAVVAGLRRPAVRIALAGLALVLVAAGAVAALTGPDSYRVTATFANAPGIYDGNAVKLLGVRVGRVASVTPTTDGVEVVMEIDEGTELPADATAFLMAPNVVNDRFIEFGPGYTGGPQLEDGASLPVERTVLPQSVDQIIASIDRLATELGPKGANADGSLSELLHAIADRLGGQGGSINASVANLGEVFGAVADDTDDVTSLLDDMGDLTSAAAGVSEEYQSFAADLADVTTTLAEDDVAIGAAIKSLGDVLSQLNTFVDNNKEQLGDTLIDLSTVAAAIGDRQRAFARSLRLTPLAVQNVGRTIKGGGVVTRFDPVRDPVLQQQICGDGVLRLLVLSLAPDQTDNDVMELACGTNDLITGLDPGPGAPSAAAFTRKALLSLGGR